MLLASLGCGLQTARAASLTIPSGSTPAATVGVAYNASLQASGGTPGYRWQLTYGSLPKGLSLSAAGVLSGTPAQAGTWALPFMVTDSASPAHVVARMISISVAVAPATAPALSNSAPVSSTQPVSKNSTWYVRPDGGTRYSSNVTGGQCDGLSDAAYPGKGVNQHCAFNDIRLLWQDGSYGFFNSSFPAAGWVGKGGDTYIVRGSIGAGTSPYRVGWSAADSQGADPALVAAGNPAPYRGWRGDPYSGPPSPPSGTALQHTRILGENWQSCHAQSARTPVVAGFAVGSAFNFSTSYVDFQCFDISDKSECTSNCTNQDYGKTGISLANTADHLTLSDVRIHGMKNFGIYGPSGDGDSFSYLALIGNGQGGWNADASDGLTGTGSLLVKNYEIKWNGCMEEYPITDKLPYRSCTDQSSGGYGDGFGTATVASKPGWQVTFDQGEVSYNTQDGLDALHLIGGNSSITVSRTLAYGNMGQQIKVGGAAGALFDSAIVGNCKAMSNAIPGTPSGYNAQLTNFCRAGNQPVLMTVGHGTTTYIRHNTILGAGYLLIGYACDGTNGNCDSTALVDMRDNILLGNYNSDRMSNPGANYVMVADGSYTTPAACNAAPHHYWTTDGFVGCNNDVFFNAGSYNDHNIYSNVKDSCNDHNGTSNLCMSPGLVSEVQPAYGYPDLSLSPHGAAAFHGGISLSGLLTDYGGLSFNLIPSIGALESGSALVPYQAQQ